MRRVTTHVMRVLYAVNVALWTAVVAGLVRIGVPFRELGWDLESFSVGSRMLLAKQPIYDFEAQARAHVALGHPGFAPFPFVNPPILAIELVPLAVLPHAVAFVVLLVASLVALAVAARLATGDVRSALWVTASYPALTALGQGQLAFFALLLFAVVRRELTQGRVVRAGLIASLLFYKPQLLVGLVLAFAISPLLRRALVGLLLGLGAQLAVCLVFAREATLAWPGALARFAVYTLKPAQSYTWHAFFELLLPAHRSTALALGVGATAAMFVLGVIAMRRARRDVDALVAIAVLVTLLGAWHCNSYDWVLAALPAWLLASRVEPSRTVVWLYAAGSTVLLLNTVDAQQAAMGFAIAPAVLIGTAFSVWLVKHVERAAT